MSDKQYVLSLDSLDLSLLSQFVDKPSTGTRTLWSKTFMDGEATYCQVNLICDEYQNEDNYFAVSETYQCHICNKDVPKMYYKQHVQSKMHNNYRKLTEKILENLTKQINADIDTIDTNKHYNQFYCETCSKVVTMEFKQKHKNSVYHLKSLENQQLTDDFIEEYFGNKETEIVNKHDIKLDFQDNIRDGTPNFDNLLEADLKESNSVDNKNYTVVFPINQKICIKSELPNLYESSLKNDNVISDSENEFQLLDCSEEIANFQIYIKDMIERYQLQYEIPTIEDNSIIIVTPKGFREKISVNVFHGFRSTLVVYCYLCQRWLDDNYINHIRTEIHVRNITQPVNDDFIRDVLQNRDWSHCLLCNMMVLKGSNHAALRHKQYMKGNENKAIALPTKPSDISNQTFCDACNRHIINRNFNSHVKSKKHKNNLKAKIDESNAVLIDPNCTQTKHEQNKIFNETSSPVVLVEGNITTQKAILIDQMYCDTCKVKVPKGGMERHIDGKSHKNKCRKEKKTIDNIKSEPNKLITNQYLPDLMTSGNDLPSTSQDMAVHLASQEHIENITIEKYVEYKKQTTHISEKELKCLVCQVKIPNKDKSIISHVEASKHTKIMNNLLLVSKITKKFSKFFHCELCDSYIDNFIDHINKDVNHIIKFSEFYKVELTEYVHDNPLKINALAHVYRRLHKEMLDRNKIIRISNTHYHCGVCTTRFPVRQEIEHISSLNHLLVLKSHLS